MSQHARTTIRGGGSTPPGSPSKPMTSATKARIIVLLSVLAIVLSAFAVFRVAMRNVDEPNDEIITRATAIEMQLDSGQPVHEEPAANAPPPGEGRRRGAGRSPK